MPVLVKHVVHPEKTWHEAEVETAAEVTPLAQAVVSDMENLLYGERGCFAMRLALEEALVNAVRHGNRADPAKRARVRYRVARERVMAEVEDKGAGFDPAAVPDPRTPGNQERPAGRGVFLKRRYLTAVSFNERGNRVTLCPCRSARPRPDRQRPISSGPARLSLRAQTSLLRRPHPPRSWAGGSRGPA
jgi:serine/threonine-protein kinase RsbW